MKVIFLDFDGVMNHREWCYANTDTYHYKPINPEAAATLDKLLDQVTGCQIVISSVWRLDGIAKCLKYLRLAGFNHWRDVMDVTGSSQFGRGQEISDWLKDRPDVTHYVILDDDAFDMGTQMDKLIHIDRETGLTTDHFPAILKHLE
jgi:hypothetical protein